MKTVIPSKSGNQAIRIWAMTVIFTVIMLMIAHLMFAQDEPQPVSREEQKLVVDSIAAIMTRSYVYPEVAEKMNRLITDKQSGEEYDPITGPSEFAEQLTADLRSVSNDKHIGVVFAPSTIALMRASQENPENDEYEKRIIKELHQSNFGFEELKILPGNIGYLKFSRFADTRYGAAETAAAVMQFLAHTNAIIFDLRGNGGGNPHMIQLLTTYLFDDTDIRHLNTFYWRPTNETNQFWTLPHVPGIRRPDVDVYILTSGRTFSGAEEFTYNLKNMERAVIVGEVTGGGAHPVDRVIINDRFAIQVPMGKAINPVTQTNWEGTGITPHYEVPADMALGKALALALDSLASKAPDEETRGFLTFAALRQKALAEPSVVDEKTLKSLAGNYGPRKVSLDNGTLWYQREDRPRMRMIPAGDKMFIFSELDYFLLEFIEENGRITAVQGRYADGRTDRNEREK